MSSNSMRFCRRLNRDSLAKSVVGLAEIFLGGDKRLPLYSPEIILITYTVTVTLLPVTGIVVRCENIAHLQTGMVLQFLLLVDKVDKLLCIQVA